MSEKVFVLNAEGLAILREMVKSEADRRHNSPTHNSSEDTQFTPETYIANASVGIPALTPSIGTGTGAIPGVAPCDIYKVDLTSGQLTLVYNMPKNVYNLSTTAITNGWLPIWRDKYGSWLCAASDVTGNSGGSSSLGCNCFNCVTFAQATVTGCGACTNNAAPQYQAALGTWDAWPLLAGNVTLNYDSGCIWRGPTILLDVGTGTASGTYQWVLTMAGASTTLQLTLTAGTDVAGVI